MAVSSTVLIVTSVFAGLMFIVLSIFGVLWIRKRQRTSKEANQVGQVGNVSLTLGMYDAAPVKQLATVHPHAYKQEVSIQMPTPVSDLPNLSIASYIASEKSEQLHSRLASQSFETMHQPSEWPTSSFQLPSESLPPLSVPEFISQPRIVVQHDELEETMGRVAMFSPKPSRPRAATSPAQSLTTSNSSQTLVQPAFVKAHIPISRSSPHLMMMKPSRSPSPFQSPHVSKSLQSLDIPRSSSPLSIRSGISEDRSNPSLSQHRNPFNKPSVVENGKLPFQSPRSKAHLPKKFEASKLSAQLIDMDDASSVLSFDVVDRSMLFTHAQGR